MLRILQRLKRFFHCLLWWHTPVDGTCALWCRTCGKEWPILFLFLASSVRAESPDDVIARLDAINRRLEAMPPAPTPQTWPVPRTYAEARQQAIQRGLPLVVWSGEALCVACVKQTTADGVFVNWVGSVPGLSSMSTTSNVIIVGLPENGELYYVATITQWETLGHVASTKAAIKAFRQTRTVIRQDRPTRATTYQDRVEAPAFRVSAGAGC